MKLRTDLLEFLTDQDILEEDLANIDRYKAEPQFSKTGKGYLRSATPEERVQEMARSKASVKKLKKRMREAGKFSKKRKDR